MESAFEVDGPHYFIVLALHVLPPEKWRATRVEILRRLLVTSQARAVAPGGATRSVLASGSRVLGCLLPGLCSPRVFKSCLAASACSLKVCSFDLVIDPDPSQSIMLRVWVRWLADAWPPLGLVFSH